MQYTEWTYRDFLRSEWWRRTSARLKREQNYTCQDCGQRKPANELVAHHEKYGLEYERDDDPSIPWWARGRGWAVYDMWCRVVCEDCHDVTHCRGTWQDVQRRIDNITQAAR